MLPGRTAQCYGKSLLLSHWPSPRCFRTPVNGAGMGATAALEQPTSVDSSIHQTGWIAAAARAGRSGRYRTATISQSAATLSGPKACALGQRFSPAQARSASHFTGRRISRTPRPSPILSPDNAQRFRRPGLIGHFYICNNQAYSSMNRLLIACECVTNHHVLT